MKKIRFGLEKNFDAKIGLIDPPSPATKHVPEWYKDGEMYLNQKAGLNIQKNEEPIAGMKSCRPFLDAISSGYMLTTWAHVEITENYNNQFSFKYLEKTKDGEYVDSLIDYEVLAVRPGDSGHTIPRPTGHAHAHLIWKGRWGVQTPKGWSVLVTHPMNQFQLPFTTLSGIMDSDKFFSNGNIPFFIKDGWTGIIEKGTPFAQIVPIKRSSWMSINEEEHDFAEFLSEEARRNAPGYYKNKLWIPKKYK